MNNIKTDDNIITQDEYLYDEYNATYKTEDIMNVDNNAEDGIENSEQYRYNIDTYTNAIPVERLVDDFNNQIIEIPKFQRPYVWAKKDSKTNRSRPSLFIDSVLLGLPIPPVIIYKDAQAREKGLIIDGQQRIKTLAWFLTSKLEGADKQFKLAGEGIFREWKNKTFKELEPKHQDFLKRAYIPVTYVRQLSGGEPPLPEASSLYILFDRLNSGGQALHPHEKRTVLTIHNEYGKNLDEFMEKIYSLEEWKNIFSFIDIQKHPESITQYRELIFRIYPFLLDIDNYKGNLSKFLDTFVLTYQMKQTEVETLVEITKDVLMLVLGIQPDNHKLFKPKKLFNTSFYVAVMVTLLRLKRENQYFNIEFVKEFYVKCNDESVYDPKGRSSKATGAIIDVFQNAYNIALDILKL